ncbi:MAG: alpha/beta hydrolase [Lutibacter sp.]|jgi:alpha-beta hydrolase superfamily lysophospholipase|nr:alpha/beta hydrolase [Lutibacter sp.]
MKRNYTVLTKDHLKLQVCRWGGLKKPRLSLLLIHGLGEHQGRYQHMADHFVNAGIELITYDQRGHGISEGKRGHSPGLNHTLNDLERVIKSLNYEKLFLYGHSFGGNVLANFLLRKQPKYLCGAILSAPWLLLKKKPNVLEVEAAGMLSPLFPSFTKNNQIKATDLSSIPEVCKAYQEDPYCHNRISLRLFTDFYKAGKQAISAVNKLKTPCLLVHGTEDPIIDIKGAKSFVNNSKGMAVLKQYANTRHEIHNDRTQKTLFKDVQNWIEKQL